MPGIVNLRGGGGRNKLAQMISLMQLMRGWRADTAQGKQRERMFAMEIMKMGMGLGDRYPDFWKKYGSDPLFQNASETSGMPIPEGLTPAPSGLPTLEEKADVSVEKYQRQKELDLTASSRKTIVDIVEGSGKDVGLLGRGEFSRGEKDKYEYYRLRYNAIPGKPQLIWKPAREWIPGTVHDTWVLVAENPEDLQPGMSQGATSGAQPNPTIDALSRGASGGF